MGTGPCASFHKAGCGNDGTSVGLSALVPSTKRAVHEVHSSPLLPAFTYKQQQGWGDLENRVFYETCSQVCVIKHAMVFYCSAVSVGCS